MGTNDLYEKYRDATVACQGILERAALANDGAGRDLTATEREEFERRSADAASAKARIEDIKDQEARNAQAADFAKSIGYQRSGNGQADTWLPSRSEHREHRAVDSGDAAGYLVVEHASTWWRHLTAKSVVLAAGPTILPTSSTQLMVPTTTAGVTVGNYNEAAEITPSDPGLDALELTPRKFAAITIVGNEALDDSSPELRRVIGDTMIADTALKVDEQMLVGGGTPPALRGLFATIGLQTAALGSGDGATPDLDTYADMLAALEAANGDIERAAWFMHPRSWSTVRKLQDLDERYQMSPDPSRDAPRSLFGVPVHLSTQIPANVTVGESNDTTSVGLVDMSRVVVAQRRTVELAMSEHHRFEFDQTSLRVVARLDIGVTHPAAVVTRTAVRA